MNLKKSLSHFKTNLTTQKQRQKTTRASKSAGIDNKTIQGVSSGLCLNLYFLLPQKGFEEDVWGKTHSSRASDRKANSNRSAFGKNIVSTQSQGDLEQVSTHNSEGGYSC